MILYHLTDRSKFKLDAKYEPSDNAVAIQDRSGRPGIYLGRSVETWVNGFGYWRPFVVEFEVDDSVVRDAGVHGRYGGEMFVPATSFDKLSIVRVIPIDAYAREEYGEPGWIESDLGVEFDTGAPIVGRGKPGWAEAHKKYKSYRYSGPDVRSMPSSEAMRLKKQLRRAKPRVATKNPLSPPAKTAIIIGAVAAAAIGVVAIFTRKSSASGTPADPQPGPEPSTPQRIAVVGDSLAVGLIPELQKLATRDGVALKGEGKSGTTPKQWSIHAAACGQCGDWIPDFNPTIVLVVLGTNDVGYASPPRIYYEHIRDRLQALSAKVVWIQPNRMTKYSLDAVRAVIDSLGVAVVPAAAIPISADGVHPSGNGYFLWAQKIWTSIS